MLKIRVSETQNRVKLFVFIFVTSRCFDWLCLKPGHRQPDIVTLNVRDIGYNISVKYELMQAEKIRVETCVKVTDIEIQRELERFEANRNISINHHQYLKEVDSFVVEVGGHRGEDAAMMVSLYNPRYIILEPVDMYADILREKFKSNPRVTVMNFGLGNRSENVNIHVESKHQETNSNLAGKTTITVKNATEFFTSIRVGKFDIDLLTLDCDGCELGVLENIIESNLVKNFKNIQFKSYGRFTHVQNTEINSKDRYCKIEELLSRTHRLTIQYKYVFENWRRNDIK